MQFGLGKYNVQNVGKSLTYLQVESFVMMKLHEFCTVLLAMKFFLPNKNQIKSNVCYAIIVLIQMQEMQSGVTLLVVVKQEQRL